MKNDKEITDEELSEIERILKTLIKEFYGEDLEL